MAYNSPILGPLGVGMVGNDGKLTKAARESFVSQVILLLEGGNSSGKGPKISSILGIPFPPIPGPKIVDPDRLLLRPNDPIGDLFWFDPSPIAAAMTPFLVDNEKDYQKIIVSNLYEPLVNMLNVPGNVVAPPLFDPTCFFEVNVDVKEFLTDLNITIGPPTTPALQLNFAKKYGLDVDAVAKFVLDFPKILGAPPIPPTIPVPPVPNFDFIIFPDLFLSILSIPLEILKPDFVISLITVPIPDPGEISAKIVGIVFDLVLKALEKIGLLTILPKLLSATITIIVQNLVSMLVCDIIGTVLGTGQVVKTAGTFLGLS